jgi:hypothetical protein
MVGGQDLTPAVQNGLAGYYGLIALANVVYGAIAHYRLKDKVQGFIWPCVGGFFAILALLNLAHVSWVRLPAWYKDLSDHGIVRSLMHFGVVGTAANSVFYVLLTLLILMCVVCAIDVVYSFASWRRNGGHSQRANSHAANGNGMGWLAGLSEPVNRITWELVIIALLGLLLYGTNAISYFVASVVAFAAFIIWRKVITKPMVMWSIFNAGLLFGGLSMTDYDFRTIIVKPDNVPIVGLVFVVGFFSWLAFRKAVINDERRKQGLPPAEKEEEDKVLVWPDLVYTELICMVVVTVVLIVWSVALPAPLEQPASSTRTPNPSKAPWYFLGLQEMLVYYDPWLAGVVLPTLIILGLMAMPYIDFNQKGNGYYTFEERPFAIVVWLFGFIVLWVTLIFLGTFLRGPNWNFFGIYEPWDPHKVVPQNNVNLSDYFWVRGLGVVWTTNNPQSLGGFLTILMRELPGIAVILGYFLLLPPILAKTVFRDFYLRMGFIRYMTMIIILLFMASLPIKMILRWTINLKYIVAIPEYFFNI